MADRSYLNIEDELDEKSPYDSITTRDPLEDVNGLSLPEEIPGSDLPVPAPNPVRDAIQKRISTQTPSAGTDYATDPLMQQYEKKEQDLNDYRQAKLQSDNILNLGQAFSQAARGANAPVSSDALYSNLAKQGDSLLKSKEEDVDRRQKIVNAIEARKMRQQMEEGRREDRNLTREEIASRYSMARADKKEKQAEKIHDRELALNVPGFERTGEVLTKPEEAAKLRGAVASADELSKKLGRLKELVKQYGSFEKGGEGGAEMESLATEIQLLAKNQDMYNLGVLTGPDMNLLTKITADPGSIDSLFTRDSTRQKQIDTQLSSVINKLNTKAKSMGYRRVNESSLPKESHSNKTVVKKQYSPSRDKTKLIYEDGTEEIIDGQG